MVYMMLDDDNDICLPSPLHAAHIRIYTSCRSCSTERFLTAELPNILYQYNYKIVSIIVMSEYISYTPQARYRHVAHVSYATDACVQPVPEVFRNRNV